MSEVTYGIFPSDSNRSLTKKLREKGISVVEFPPFLTVDTGMFLDFSADLSEQFDWIIFSDLLAAEHFLSQADRLDFDLSNLDSVRICVFGESASDALRFSQIHSDVIAAFPARAEAIETLVDYIGQNHFRGTRFLYLTQIGDRNSFAEKIEALGGKIKKIAIYSVDESFRRQIAKTCALLIGGAVDAVVISNARDLIALELMLRSSGRALDDLNIPLFTTSSAEYNATLEAGFKPVHIIK